MSVCQINKMEAMFMTAEFEWDGRCLLGHQGIDNAHREFAVLVDAMLSASDRDFPAALDAFALHAERHFHEENLLMSLRGFPARDSHMDEHDQVLASVREAQTHVALGDLDIGRELARALADWFPGHADYLDSALATWLLGRTNATPSQTVGPEIT